jgi:hypothetical protein
MLFRRPKRYDEFHERLGIPEIPDGMLIPFAPVLQINAIDVPEFPFPLGKDLLQLLWYPQDTDDPPYQCVPRVLWRNSQTVVHPLAVMPSSPHANPHLIPKPCTLTFERVMEYPDSDEFTSEQLARLDAWIDREKVPPLHEDDDIKETLYQFELSTCPGNKLGGYAAWIQNAQWKTCESCGRQMEHLLTLTDMDVDGGTWQRWLALEDRELWQAGYQHELANAPDWWLGGGSMYYFVCRQCADWPVKPVYQR